MSFLVHNFLKPNLNLTVTPRFKVFFVLKNINTFLVLFKFKPYLDNFSSRINILNFFFYRGMFLFFFNISKKLSAHYTNSLTQTGVYLAFKILNEFFRSNKSIQQNLKISKHFQFNHYFLSIKFTNFRLINFFYKKLFYTYTFVSNLWYQQQANFFFFMNFFFIRNNFKLFKWTGGYFFKVRNV